MAVGTALRFQRDAQGRPLVMYIRDLLAACTVCGHEIIQRAYAQVSYHHLTVARFRALTERAPDAIEAAPCEQCGEPIGPAGVVRWAMTYGFPQEAGLIQGFGRREPDRGRVQGYALSPHRRFDVQMLPEWEPEDDQSVVRAADLTEASVRPVMGRFLSLKAGWRRALGSWLEGGGRGVQTLELARGCFGAIGPRGEALDEAVARMQAAGRAAGGAAAGGAAAGGAARWVVLDLADAINELVPAGPHEWLPADWYRRLREGRPRALALAHLGTAAALLGEALETLPGPTELAVSHDGVARVGFPLGPDGMHEAVLPLPEMLGEALVTAAAPADWIGLWLDDRLAEIAAGPDDDPGDPP